MGRGPKPAKGKAKPAVAHKSPKDEGARVRDLEKQLAEALKREAEAHEQQAATSEVLRIISASPAVLQPVLDTLVANAARVCGALDVNLHLRDGDFLPIMARYGVLPVSDNPFPVDRSSAVGQAVLDRQIIHIHDIATAGDLPAVLERARRTGFRTILAIPLLRGDLALGGFVLRRAEVHPFSDNQIELLKSFADQAVIAIENVRLFTELQEKNRALTQAHAQVTEALEQQTATSEILRVISRSPTDVQPVFDAIAESAARLCNGIFGMVYRLDGNMVHMVANHNFSPEGWAAYQALYPRPLNRQTNSGRAMLDGRVAITEDVEADTERSAATRNAARLVGLRSAVTVPLVRKERTIGALTVGRADPGAFSPKQVALLQTFADQAVIAIENVRLFTELQASNRELTTALETQTATSDILRVISQSQTDVQPVFDTILASAVRLLGAYGGLLTRIVENQMELVALEAPNEASAAAIRASYPRSLLSEGVTAQAIRNRAPLNIVDYEVDSRVSEGARVAARLHGYRSWVIVPILRYADPIGTILVARSESGGFSDDEIALLRTFADQAVIAIENVRLFTELEARNRDLTEALERQTATSEILNVISASPTDVHPVFAAICKSAVRLFGAYASALIRFDGQLLQFGAVVSPSAEADERYRLVFPRPPDRELGTGRAILDRAIVHVPDIERDTERNRELGRDFGYRRLLVVPMMRGGEAIGALAVTGREPGRYSDQQIALLQTFANQAVIAIQNEHLFRELQDRTTELSRSVDQLTALSEVGQAISSTLDLRTVLSTIVARATQLSGTDAGVIYEYDEPREVFVPRATEQLDAEIVETMLATPVRKGEGATGRLAEMQEPIQVPDILAAPAESRVRGALVRAGYRALLAVPLVREGHLIGGLTVIRRATGAFPPETIELLQTFATQSSLAIQNARLFREIEEKSRQLEAASQHKSEFLANMSHELRTPLNAIIGFSEVLSERMFGDLNEKQEEYLKDIYASGTHLLSLINDILDLSKIEAGRMELELTDFHLPTALDNALTLVRERAGRRSITLEMSVDERLGEVRADERKIRQVVLNLLSNAIKFTPEGGRIEVGAMPKDGFVEVSVSDTGVGIAPEDQEAVFEEFRQVGTADKKAEGTGLGLTLCRKFIELHGGRIWVKSQVGVGSTFTFTIPCRGE